MHVGNDRAFQGGGAVAPLVHEDLRDDGALLGLQRARRLLLPVPALPHRRAGHHGGAGSLPRDHGGHRRPLLGPAVLGRDAPVRGDRLRLHGKHARAPLEDASRGRTTGTTPRGSGGACRSRTSRPPSRSASAARSSTATGRPTSACRCAACRASPSRRAPAAGRRRATSWRILSPDGRAPSTRELGRDRRAGRRASRAHGRVRRRSRGDAPDVARALAPHGGPRPAGSAGLPLLRGPAERFHPPPRGERVGPGAGGAGPGSPGPRRGRGHRGAVRADARTTSRSRRSRGPGPASRRRRSPAGWPSGCPAT